MANQTSPSANETSALPGANGSKGIPRIVVSPPLRPHGVDVVGESFSRGFRASFHALRAIAHAPVVALIELHASAAYRWTCAAFLTIALAAHSDYHNRSITGAP